MIEWAFAICIFAEPKINPYVIKPIDHVVGPTQEVCEAARQGEREWMKVSGENYLLGPCQRLTGAADDIEKQKEALSCPFPRD